MSNSPIVPAALDDVENGSAGDLNKLLAQEQSSIMRAEAATQVEVRDDEREAARRARRAIDLTPFPRRDAHDFDANTPSQRSSIDFTVDFEVLQRRVNEMDRLLAIHFAEGIGARSNIFEHRSRLIRQTRARLGSSAT